MPRLVVVTPPVAKARARVAIRNGKPHAYTPTKTQEAEWRIRMQWMSEHGHEPLAGPVRLGVVAYVAMPKSIPKRRRSSARPTTRPDGDNFLKTVLDALQGVAFKDDAQVVEMSVEKKYAVDGPPRWDLYCEAITA